MDTIASVMRLLKFQPGIILMQMDPEDQKGHMDTSITGTLQLCNVSDQTTISSLFRMVLKPKTYLGI